MAQNVPQQNLKHKPNVKFAGRRVKLPFAESGLPHLSEIFLLIFPRQTRPKIIKESVLQPLSFKEGTS
jgi:hypothetical protein